MHLMHLMHLMQMQLHSSRLRHVTRGRQQLALSPQAAEALAGFGDWMRGPECRLAVRESGISLYGDPYTIMLGEIGVVALLSEDGGDSQWSA